MTQKEFRAFRKKAGVCRDCGKEDAYTMAGRTYCAECAEKDRLRKEEARKCPEKRQKMLTQHREMVARKKAAGVCSCCGKRLAVPGKTMCGICLWKQRSYQYARRHEQGQRTWTERTDGKGCFLCGKPCVPGRKLCEKHMIQRIENLRRSNPGSVYLPTEKYLQPSVR